MNFQTAYPVIKTAVNEINELKQFLPLSGQASQHPLTEQTSQIRTYKAPNQVF